MSCKKLCARHVLVILISSISLEFKMLLVFAEALDTFCHTSFHKDKHCNGSNNEDIKLWSCGELHELS